MKNKGFTLIELLVVIAIIGILAGLIIVSLNDATLSAKDAKIRAALDQLRNQAAVYKAQNGTYVGLAADSKIEKIKSDIAKELDVDAAGLSLFPTAPTKAEYCAQTNLLTSDKKACVDNQGNAFTNLDVGGHIGECAGQTCQ